MKTFDQWINEMLDFDLEHTIGNPLFAIETNLEPLRKRIREGRVEEALVVVQSIANSVEQAKIALFRIAGQQ